MGTWTSYSLSDFLLFSLHTYQRLFELHNAAWWPVHFVAAAIGLVVLYLHVKPSLAGDRILFGLLAVVWIWLAWAFFWERYQPINWTAIHVIPVIAALACLLGWLALRPTRRLIDPQPGMRWITCGLLLFSFVGYPLLGLSLGRSWQGAEYFGLMPDPTALASISLLIFYRGPVIRLAQGLLIIWCAISGVTLWGLGSTTYFIAPVGAAIAVGAMGVMRLKRLKR